MAESHSSGKIRLFQKSLRAPQLLVKPQSGEKHELQTSASQLTFLPPREPSKARMIPTQGKSQQFKGGQAEEKPRPLRSIHQSPSVRKLRVKRHTGISKTDVSMTVAQSLGDSFVVSRDDSPSATLDAINLELSLTSILEQIERLPSGARQQRRLQAYVETLGATAAADAVFGPVLGKIKREIEKMLKAAKLTAVEDLQSQNSKLTTSLSDLTHLAKSEKDDRQARDRVYENLSKENSLLQKKIEELDNMLKKNASRPQLRKSELNFEHIVGELKAKTRKIKELDEEVKAARMREAKLTDLLNWMQADSSRTEVFGTEDGIQRFSARVKDRTFSRNKMVPELDLREEEESGRDSRRRGSQGNKGLEETTSSSAAIAGTPDAASSLVMQGEKLV